MSERITINLELYHALQEVHRRAMMCMDYFNDQVTIPKELLEKLNKSTKKACEENMREVREM